MSGRPITIRFVGVKRLEKKMQKSRAGVKSGTAQGTLAAMTIVFDQSQVLCPVETGALKATGRLEHDVSGQNYRCHISYGGPSTPRFVDYATYVHEIVDHKHAPPTTSKFVEIPLMAALHSGTAIGVMKQYISGHLIKAVK